MKNKPNDPQKARKQYLKRLRADIFYAMSMLSDAEIFGAVLAAMLEESMHCEIACHVADASDAPGINICRVHKDGKQIVDGVLTRATSPETLSYALERLAKKVPIAYVAIDEPGSHIPDDYHGIAYHSTNGKLAVYENGVMYVDHRAKTDADISKTVIADIIDSVIEAKRPTVDTGTEPSETAKHTATDPYVNPKSSIDEFYANECIVLAIDNSSKITDTAYVIPKVLMTAPEYVDADEIKARIDNLNTALATKSAFTKAYLPRMGNNIIRTAIEETMMRSFGQHMKRFSVSEWWGRTATGANHIWMSRTNRFSTRKNQVTYFCPIIKITFKKNKFEKVSG